MVDRSVEGVGDPERKMQGTTRHAVRTKKYIAAVPGDEWEGDEEPAERNVAWRVRPGS